MKLHVPITRLITFLTLFSGLFVGLNLQAQILAPSAQEVKYSYTTSFEIPNTATEETDEEKASLHASHLFGLFHSSALVKKFAIPSFIGGIGGPRSQMKIKILSSEVRGKKTLIKYSNSGKMLLHRLAAQSLIASGTFVLPMPTNPYEIFDQNCTDEHYNTFTDYWYFYDVFKKGCTHLAKSPYATPVSISIRASEYKKLQTKVQLPAVRADNGNGKLFSIYVIHGFESDTKDREDLGRLNFNEFNYYLRQNDFFEDKQKSPRNSSLMVYTKDLILDNGKQIQVEVKHLLVETSMGSRSKNFANFFKEAVANADVIIYSGHSGLGSNLDIPSLETKAGAFQFNPQKKQIFYFDSCSSYSYYLEHFAVEKTKAKIDVVTNGLSSYFNTSNAVLNKLMDHLLSPQAKDVDWSQVLQDMENVLDGDTYLLNVGGI